MDSRMTRSRKRQYSQVELARILGVSRSTVQRMERQFLTDLQRRYLAAIKYRMTAYPDRANGGTDAPE